MLDIEFFAALHAKLGMMTWPLTLLSALMLMLIVERAMFVLLNSKTKSKQLQQQIYALALNNDAELDSYVLQHQRDKGSLAQGLCMLISHRHVIKTLREEAVSLWLQKERRQFMAGLKLLNAIGVLSPLIGLLGTVMGLIDMFKNLASTQGSIAPAALADGLGLAMTTTAAGLLIALPAIAGAQLVALWAEHKLAKIEHALNRYNLHLTGAFAPQAATCNPNCHAVCAHPTASSAQ